MKEDNGTEGLNITSKVIIQYYASNDRHTATHDGRQDDFAGPSVVLILYLLHD
jgi:hypothetical protein